MTNFYAKLFLPVFVGTLGLGFSAQAQARLAVDWVFAGQKLDCPATCGKTGLKFPIPTGFDHKTGKPSYYICATNKGDQWRAGYNMNGGTRCVIGIDNEEYHGTEYYCQCTNDPRRRPFI